MASLFMPASLSLMLGVPSYDDLQRIVADLHSILAQLIVAAQIVWGELHETYKDTIEFLRENIHAIVTLGTASAAIWKWWRYRNAVLFKRLDSYLKQEEKRLAGARAGISRSIFQPNLDSPQLAAPLALGALTTMLKRWSWAPTFSFYSTEASAQRRLNGALAKLTKAREARDERFRQLNGHLATAHLLLGLVDASRAEVAGAGDAKRRHQQLARQHYDDALGIPGSQRDIDALELKANLLLKIGDFESAKEVLETVVRIDDETRMGRRSKADEIKRARAIKGLGICATTSGNNGKARDCFDEAYDILAQYNPLSGTDLLELAECRELFAGAHNRLNNPKKFATAIREANERYEELAVSLAPKTGIAATWRHFHRLIWGEHRLDQLIAAANAGVARTQPVAQSEN